MTGFKPGDRVRHHAGVDGTVTRANGNFATVEWDAYVRANTHHIDLLTPLGEPVASEKNFTGRNGIVLGILTMSAPAGHFGMDVDDVGVHISDGDAPAIALAILEAAGVLAKQDRYTTGTPEHLQSLTYRLKQYVKTVEQRAKAAAEQESLGAEALVLLNAMRADGGVHGPASSWEGPHGQAREMWVAIARAARELHGVTA